MTTFVIEPISNLSAASPATLTASGGQHTRNRVDGAALDRSLPGALDNSEHSHRL